MHYECRARRSIAKESMSASVAPALQSGNADQNLPTPSSASDTDLSRASRRATAMAGNEIETSWVCQLRYRVYVHEQGRPLKGIDTQHGELTDPLDACSCLWYAKEGDAVVGTLTQTIIGPHFDLSLLPAALELDTFPHSAGPFGYTTRFVIAPGQRGMWVLPSLARDSYAHGRMLGGKFDFMATNPSLVPLFERMGYVRYTKSGMYSDDIGLLIPMVLPATDREYLRSMRSACLPAAERFADEPEWHTWLRARRPMIGIYYDSERRHQVHAATLARRTCLPLDIAMELSTMSFTHQFPAGTILRRPGDRVTYDFLALDGRLSMIWHDDDESPVRCAPDGVAFSRVTIRCETDADVLCVPDSAIARLQRRYPEHSGRLGELLQPTATGACAEGFLR